MPTTIEKKLSQARTESALRNRGMDDQQAEIRHLEAQVAILQNKIADQQLYISDLESQLDRANQQLRAMPREKPVTSAQRTKNGRPVLTISEVQKRTLYSYMQVYRAVSSGKLQGVQDSNLEWLVYADQAIIIQTKNRRK